MHYRELGKVDILVPKGLPCLKRTCVALGEGGKRYAAPPPFGEAWSGCPLPATASDFNAKSALASQWNAIKRMQLTYMRFVSG